MNKEYILKHNGKWIIDTHHAIERMAQRGAESKDGLFTFLKNMIDRMLTLKGFHTRPNNIEYFVWSRQLQRGFIIAYRRDTKTNSRKKQFVLVTVYPKKAKNRNPVNPEITIK